MRTSRCAKSGKVRYRTSLDAKIALAKTHRSRKPKRDEKRYYRCPYCDGWHLTSKEWKPNKGVSD